MFSVWIVYGNLITNIRKDIFDITYTQESFTIEILKEFAETKLPKGYDQVEPEIALPFFTASIYWRLVFTTVMAADFWFEYDSMIQINFVP